MKIKILILGLFLIMALPVSAASPGVYLEYGETAQIYGRVSGAASVTGLQTVIVRDFVNTTGMPLTWDLVRFDEDNGVTYYVSLRLYAMFVFDNETVLVLVSDDIPLGSCEVNALLVRSERHWWWAFFE